MSRRTQFANDHAYRPPHPSMNMTNPYAFWAWVRSRSKHNKYKPHQGTREKWRRSDNRPYYGMEDGNG